MVICLGNYFLFKSILACCVALINNLIPLPDKLHMPHPSAWIKYFVPWTMLFCYINLSNLVWTKGFDTIIFHFPGVFKFGKWESNDNFATWDEVERVNLSRDSQFLKRDDSVKMEINSGKTLSPANLSNEYNRMLVLIFHSRGLFPIFGQCTKRLQ